MRFDLITDSSFITYFPTYIIHSGSKMAAQQKTHNLKIHITVSTWKKSQHTQNVIQPDTYTGRLWQAEESVPPELWSAWPSLQASCPCRTRSCKNADAQSLWAENLETAKGLQLTSYLLTHALRITSAPTAQTFKIKDKNSICIVPIVCLDTEVLGGGQTRAS